MANPLNQLPADPDWIRKVGEFTEHAARELGCAVALVAIQENGKCAIETAGIPDSGPLPPMFADMSSFFYTCGRIVALNDAIEALQPRS